MKVRAALVERETVSEDARVFHHRSILIPTSTVTAEAGGRKAKSCITASFTPLNAGSAGCSHRRKHTRWSLATITPKSYEVEPDRRSGGAAVLNQCAGLLVQ
jgi:hypothetical protein